MPQYTTLTTNINNNGGAKRYPIHKDNLPSVDEEDLGNGDADSDGLNQTHLKIGKPPRNFSVIRHCISSARLAAMAQLEDEVGISGHKMPSNDNSQFSPIFRSGSCSDKGPKRYMEDEHISVNNLIEHFGEGVNLPSPGAFYGASHTFIEVFDGHNGTDAASFAKRNILNLIIEDSHFPRGMKKAVKSAFIKADNVFAEANALDKSSGTTALTAIILGRRLTIANAGDSRAVLGKRGIAMELSRDHKPNCSLERQRIEKLGGTVYDGYLDGQLSVARALGDWHIKGQKGTKGPLSSEPEVQEVMLTEEDEFLIMGCDGLWDVMSSQCAVTMVRKELMLHNDPERCSRELVKEALKRNCCDNLTVVVVCFSSDPPPKIEIPRSQKRRSISAEGLDLLKCVLDNT
ncbi:PPM-type phosphatase-like domain [Dillenia turbinata]|uniref:protein-serine/threonine phosphatase n=1 Tax=Dillenia turbinata TaxID=194707 RepID=A0AAN8V4F7_9MAGN